MGEKIRDEHDSAGESARGRGFSGEDDEDSHSTIDKATMEPPPPKGKLALSLRLSAHTHSMTPRIRKTELLHFSCSSQVHVK